MERTSELTPYLQTNTGTQIGDHRNKFYAYDGTNGLMRVWETDEAGNVSRQIIERVEKHMANVGFHVLAMLERLEGANREAA